MIPKVLGEIVFVNVPFFRFCLEIRVLFSARLFVSPALMYRVLCDSAVLFLTPFLAFRHRWFAVDPARRCCLKRFEHFCLPFYFFRKCTSFLSSAGKISVWHRFLFCSLLCLLVKIWTQVGALWIIDRASEHNWRSVWDCNTREYKVTRLLNGYQLNIFFLFCLSCGPLSCVLWDSFRNLPAMKVYSMVASATWFFEHREWSKNLWWNAPEFKDYNFLNADSHVSFAINRTALPFFQFVQIIIYGESHQKLLSLPAASFNRVGFAVRSVPRDTS